MLQKMVPLRTGNGQAIIGTSGEPVASPGVRGQEAVIW